MSTTQQHQKGDFLSHPGQLLNTSLLSTGGGAEDMGLSGPAEQKSASTSEADSKREMLQYIK